MLICTYLIAVDFSGYTRANAIPIIFPAGSSQTVVEVNITNDQFVETSERFFGRIISGKRIDDIEIFAPNATVDITDNDSELSPSHLSPTPTLAQTHPSSCSLPLFLSPTLSPLFPFFTPPPCCGDSRYLFRSVYHCQ